MLNLAYNDNLISWVPFIFTKEPVIVGARELTKGWMQMNSVVGLLAGALCVGLGLRLVRVRVRLELSWGAGALGPGWASVK